MQLNGTKKIIHIYIIKLLINFITRPLGPIRVTDTSFMQSYSILKRYFRLTHCWSIVQNIAQV